MHCTWHWYRLFSIYFVIIVVVVVVMLPNCCASILSHWHTLWHTHEKASPFIFSARTHTHIIYKRDGVSIFILFEIVLMSMAQSAFVEACSLQTYRQLFCFISFSVFNIGNKYWLAFLTVHKSIITGLLLSAWLFYTYAVFGELL